jgi:NAD+ synthase (glutamine-hydrolysing)
MQMPRDIGHPYPQGEPVYDVTFENVQAGERTSHLFRLTNFHNAMVGTGDLSELALGWATYGVGDQMSHYHVNASVPKTLIQHLVRWVAESGQLDARVNTALRSILETEISPELIPGAAGNPGGLQSSEAVIGPFELQDFHLYYITRFGFRPSKVVYLAERAWGNRDHGPGPSSLRRTADASTTSTRLRSGSKSFFIDSSRPVNSSDRRCLTRQKSGPGGRSRLVATGARRAIPRPRCGWRN